jgi:uncharacterized protein (DUF4415 family)
MNSKRTSEPFQPDVPYAATDAAAVAEFWDQAIVHHGLTELRSKRGRPPKDADARKEQVALRIDADVLQWYRAKGPGWQMHMNAVLRAFRDASR